MDKKPEVVVEKAVEETTQTSSPQVEVPATEEQTAQPKDEAPKEEAQSKEEQVSDVKSEEVPDPREFQNRRLADENRRLKAERGSAFDAFRPQGQPTGPVDINFYKDEYGEVNWNAYNAAVNTQIQQVATQTAGEFMDEQTARSKHPALFEDSEVEQEIADRWIASKLRGENLSVTDIADRVAKRIGKDVSKAEKRGAEKILQEVETKEQAGLSASGQTSQGQRQAQSAEDLEDLSVRTRRGDEDAIVARLQNIPWANK